MKLSKTIPRSFEIVPNHECHRTSLMITELSFVHVLARSGNKPLPEQHWLRFMTSNNVMKSRELCLFVCFAWYCGPTESCLWCPGYYCRQGHFYWHGLILIQAWISNHTQSVGWKKTAYTTPLKFVRRKLRGTINSICSSVQADGRDCVSVHVHVRTLWTLYNSIIVGSIRSISRYCFES